MIYKIRKFAKLDHRGTLSLDKNWIAASLDRLQYHISLQGLLARLNSEKLRDAIAWESFGAKSLEYDKFLSTSTFKYEDQQWHMVMYRAPVRVTPLGLGGQTYRIQNKPPQHQKSYLGLLIIYKIDRPQCSLAWAAFWIAQICWPREAQTSPNYWSSTTLHAKSHLLIGHALVHFSDLI